MKFFDKAAYGDNWPELARACKERDNYTCQQCGYNQRSPFNTEYRQMHADHIVPLSKNGKNILRNLQTLCGKCHERKTNRNRPAQWKVHYHTPKPKKPKHRISKVKRLKLK